MSGFVNSAIESPRDMAESAFTPILRALLSSVPGILAVVFVDGEGECIDYCTALSPFEAKVAGAHFSMVAALVDEQHRALGGNAWFLYLHGEARDLVFRRVALEYGLVVVTRSASLSSLLEEAVERTVRALRVEGVIPVPPWEPHFEQVRVEVRLSTIGWSYAPRAYWIGQERVAVTDVLGRWVELNEDAPDDGAGKEAICFRVRVEGGMEMTLVHRSDADVWERRDA